MEQTCDHVVVMHKGLVVADGTVDEIISGGGAATFGVDAPGRAASVLGGLDGVRSVEVDGAADGSGLVHAELNGTPRASAVRALVGAGVAVTSFAPANDPSIAVAVIIEDADIARNDIAGGRLAAPIAKQVMEAAL